MRGLLTGHTGGSGLRLMVVGKNNRLIPSSND
jgi:hypothetical protein